MKRIAMLVGAGLTLAMPLFLAAQSAPAKSGSFTNNHGEVGIYADYLRFSPSNTTTNFVGVGGRVGFNVHPNLALEGEMSYDFARNFSTTTTSGLTTNTVISSVRPLTGLFGPKLQFGTSGPFRAFVTGKLGFVDFSVNNSGVITGSTFTNAVAGVGGGEHMSRSIPAGASKDLPVGLASAPKQATRSF